MTRPSSHTDRRLIETARDMLTEANFSFLKLRDVAKRARVNLGMFHYNFKTKDIFIRRVLQEMYEEFFSQLRIETIGPGDPLDRLRHALLVFSVFARKNRKLFIALLRETLNGNRAVMEYAKANIPRHVGLIRDLVLQCQKAGLLKKLPFPVTMSLLMGAISIPNAVVTLLEKAEAKRPFGMTLKEVKRIFLSDEAIATRLDLILLALTPGKK